MFEKKIVASFISLKIFTRIDSILRKFKYSKVCKL